MTQENPNAPLTGPRAREMLQEFAQFFLSELELRDVKFLNLSQALAEKEYGAKAVAMALRACSPDQLEEFRTMAHPYGALVEWHKREAKAA